MQTDPLTHSVHIVDMIHPFLVDHTQHDQSFQFTHTFRVCRHIVIALTDFLFFHFIHLNSQLLQTICQFFLCHLLHCIILDVDLANRDHCRQCFAECIHIPFFRQLIFTHVGIYCSVHDGMDHGNDAVTQVFPIQHAFSFAVNDFSLFIHDLVIFQQLFTDGKVVAFHFFLGTFDGLCQHTCFDGFIFCHTHGIHDLHCFFGAEQTHQIIFQRDVETGFTGVTLTTGTTAQLVIDTSGFVTFCTDDLQTTQFGNTFAQLDIRTTTCHVCRNGNSIFLTCQCNDFRFLCMIFRIQYLMLDAFHFQHFAQYFGFFDGYCTNQYRLTFFMSLHDITNHCTEFACFCAVNHILQVFSLYRQVCGDLDNVHAVDVTEFVFFCFCSTGHTALFRIFIEVVLECDGSQSLAFSAHLQIFLCFDGLMQTVGVSSAGHHTTCEFIDDDDLAFVYHIVLIQMHVVVCLQGIIDMVLQFQVFGIRQVFYCKEFFCLFHTFLCQHYGFCFFIQNEVAFFLNFFFHQSIHGFCFIQDAAFFQFFNKQIGNTVQFCGLGAAAGNDQWCSGFIDQNRVHFVDDGIVQVSLNHIFLTGYHVITQVVETEFVVCTISDITVIRFTAFVVIHTIQDTANSQPQKSVNLTHLIRVTLCQIVIDCNNVYPFAFQRIQVCRQCCHQCFTFTGFHFRDSALVHDDTAHQLYGEMFHIQHMSTGRCFSYHCICFRQDIIQCFAVCQTILEFLCFTSQFFIRKRFILGTQCFDLCYDWFDLFDFLFTVVPKDFFQKTHLVHLIFHS